MSATTHCRFGLVTALIVVASSFVGAPSLDAQEEPYRLIDRVVAVVGSTPIPMSRIEEQLQMLRLQDPDMATDSASIDQMRRLILDTLIVEEILIQAAERDTLIFVVDEDVEASADEQMRGIRDAFVSELDFQREIRNAGFGTADEYRLWLVRGIRRRMLQDQLLGTLMGNGTIRPIPPTESELREAFETIVEQQRQSGRLRPPLVSFRQIAVRPEADSVSLAAARERGDSVLTRARAGEDFAALAMEFSDDPGSAQLGGNLGWFRRGSNLAREFERAAFALRPGQISNLVRTSFGFHIIQVQRAEAAEVQVRHILIAPEITEQSRQLARARADTVAQLLRDGVGLDSVLRTYHHPETESFVDLVEDANLPPVYKEAIDGAQQGDVIGPLTVPATANEQYVVILFQRRLEAGEYTYEEMRDNLRRSIAEENGVSQYIAELKNVTYIDIRY